MVSSIVAPSSPPDEPADKAAAALVSRLPTLPLELQHQVILESFDPTPTYSSLPTRYAVLHRYSLVSKTWHALVEPLLYRDLAFSDPERAKLFLASLEARGTDDPHPARVRTLRVGHVHWLGSTFAQMEADQLRAAEEDRPSVVRLPAADFGLDELVRRCDQLQDLWIAGLELVLLPTLCHAQELRGLHILRCGIINSDSETDEVPSVLPTLPRLEILECYADFDDESFDTVFSSVTAPSMRHLAFACLHDDFPPRIDPSKVTCLSTIGDFPPSFSAAPLLLLDLYQSPLRTSLPHLPRSILILRLNDLSPTLASVPWLLVDHHTSDALARALPHLRELWLPHSYLEWRDDPKRSVRDMVGAWVGQWKRRGVRVVFEEDEDEDNRRRDPDDQVLTEAAAFDFPFARLAQRVEQMALEEREAAG